VTTAATPSPAAAITTTSPMPAIPVRSTPFEVKWCRNSSSISSVDTP